jgi:uncharacterized cofD-like protein
VTSGVSSGPAVVAIGGGHGLATTLRALRLYADPITAVVTVADDGGSTGRLRRDLGVLGVGDLRKCLAALAADDEDSVSWAETFEHRFDAGDLTGHALGNLILVGLAEATGDWVQALDLAGRTLGAQGRVLPATAGPVVLRAESDEGAIQGQVAIQDSPARIRRITLDPPDAPSPPDVARALAAADQVVLAPGSLFTSLLPALAARDVRAALARASVPVVMVMNLGPQVPETVGLDAADHLRAVCDLGIRVDHLVVDDRCRLTVDADALVALGPAVTIAPVARPDVMAHAPAKLASTLAALLQS